VSQPNIPNISPTITLTRDNTIDLLLASIAMEELSLAHLINAEAEKVQFALGTLPGLTVTPTLSDVLAINASVNATLGQATKTEFLLQSKLDSLVNLINVTSGVPATPDFLQAGLTTDPAAPIVVPNLTNIPILANLASSGSSITHVPGSTDFLLAPDSTYLLVYNVVGSHIPASSLFIVPILNGLPIGAELLQPGVPDGNAGSGEIQGSGNTVFTTGPSPSILQFQNRGGTMETVTVRITLLRLS
jgi:hypothetical protein